MQLHAVLFLYLPCIYGREGNGEESLPTSPILEWWPQRLNSVSFVRFRYQLRVRHARVALNQGAGLVAQTYELGD